MSLFGEIEKLVNNEFNITLNNYRYINIDGKYVYLEGHKGILHLSDEEISFKLKKKTLSIKGYDLKIKILDNTTSVVEGNVLEVNVL